MNGDEMNTYEFEIPAALNGEQLQNELGAHDVYVRDEKLIVISEFTKTEIQAKIAVHKPILPKEPTVDEKLASVNLSLNDLKTALGL